MRLFIEQNPLYLFIGDLLELPFYSKIFSYAGDLKLLHTNPDQIQRNFN